MRVPVLKDTGVWWPLSFPPQDYYGKELQKSEDLKTNACITSARPLPKAVRDALKRVHEEVVARYYGCGLVIPECLESCRILDLGSGSGRDCYLLSQLVGEQGHVTGIDMTEGQVEVAKKHIAYHMDKFGYQKTNVEFLQGYMEKLGDAGLADESYDIVISNCVINLSPDKRAVLREAYRVLKPGGEMYFSDIYASQHLSETIRKHRVLWGECLAGALCWRDLYSIAAEVGFSPPCLVTSSPITIGDRELEGIVGEGLTRECWLQAAVECCAGIPGSTSSPPEHLVPNSHTFPLQVTAALSLQLSACSRYQVAAGLGQDRSSTMAGSWGMSESWCSMPISPSRWEEACWGSPECQTVLVCRDGGELMKQCYSAAFFVILGVSFGRGGGRWEQRGCPNQGRCKQR
ncbi:arsenite methyltransferase isoform X1 [Athene cunicularia]|uniref:arsenite methyltransferase isoform X1 n=1 Tax=Athene cunicularia TaxID=194338 RepID=UPI000EF6BE0F|nr:arsenite methyltransferase isoform X1 [Athene cunicularia]